MLQFSFSSCRSPPLRFITTFLLSSVTQHIAHKAPATGCENDVIVIQFIAQFTHKLRWRVEVQCINERPVLLHYQELNVHSLQRLLFNTCLDLLRTNHWRRSFFCHCLMKRNYTTPLICVERKQHFGWQGVCSTTHHPRLWLELGLISSSLWPGFRSHESWVMFH